MDDALVQILKSTYNGSNAAVSILVVMDDALVLLTASGITVGSLEGERTVNVTRILSLACQGCNNLNQAADWLRNHHVVGFDVDIETLQNYGNAQRFSNVRLVTEK